MSDDTDDIEYIVLTAKGWGVGQHQYEALRNLLWYNDNHAPETEATILAVRGEWEMSMYEISADEIVSEREYVFDGEKLNRIAAKLDEVEIAIEEALVSADEVEEE